jgi:hypothetical protein
MAALMVPAVLIAALRAGPVAVGLVWSSLNLGYLLVWTAVVHRRLAPGLHVPWLLKDIGAVLLPAAVLALVLRSLLGWPADRLGALAELVIVTSLVLGVAVSASSSMRIWITGVVRYHAPGGTSA